MRDPESFDDFYAGSVGRVISQLYAMTGDRAEAEDVVQEAYTRAWERWAKIARYADPESWVRTVAWRISVSSGGRPGAGWQRIAGTAGRTRCRR
jgi:RNA polymerase sigma-70 factor, ECF subfamily